VRQHQQSLVAGRQLPPGMQACPVGLQHVSQEGPGAFGQRDGARLGEQQGPRSDRRASLTF
jgi:hypothetical protein